MSGPSHTPDATCLGCGCTCDDIDLRVDDGRIAGAGNACALGRAWYGDGQVPARAHVNGVESDADVALEVTARTLAEAASPLVYLAPELTCEGQRQCVAIADLLGATLDSVSSDTVLTSILAGQRRGRASATLGEIRNRADVIVFWGVDPSERYPRFRERYAPEPIGLHLPAGRASRQVMAVDIGSACGPADADARLAVPEDDEVAVLAAIAAALSAPASTDAAPPLEETGATGMMVAHIRAGRYVAIVADAEPLVSGLARDSGRAEALIALSFAVNASARGALILLRGGGNRTGAEAVTTWQTGFPVAVDFSRGFPRYDPWTGSASARLSRGRIDAALIVGNASLLPRSLTAQLRGVATCTIGPRASEGPFAGGAAAIDTGVPGIHHAGLVLRMDDVPVPVRGGLTGPPSSEAFARALYERIVAVQRDARPEPEAARIDR